MPPSIDVTRLADGTRILIETPNCIWAFKVIEASTALLEVYGTDKHFKDSAPVKGRLLHSYEPVSGGPNEPHTLVKDWNFQVQFANVVLVGGPISTARIEGKDWSYEAIK